MPLCLPHSRPPPAQTGFFARQQAPQQAPGRGGGGGAALGGLDEIDRSDSEGSQGDFLEELFDPLEQYGEGEEAGPAFPGFGGGLLGGVLPQVCALPQGWALPVCRWRARLRLWRPQPSQVLPPHETDAGCCASARRLPVYCSSWSSTCRAWG